MLDQLKGLHIEPTNMCTLKCPRCSRTEFIDQFPNAWKNKNLNLDHLKTFLDIDLTDKNIYICGTYGDAIYYNKLFELVKYFKDNKANISLATNGSYRSELWWEQLAELLTADDIVTFGIDGLPDTFTQYRINADWSSIKTGIDVLQKTPVQLHWQHILFSYNQDNVEQAENLSKEMGFDKFILLESDRWDYVTEYLTPTRLNGLSESKIHFWTQTDTKIAVDPKCKSNDAHYISADGYYTPCCWSAEHRWYYKTEFYKNQDLYDISKTTITKVLDHLTDFYSTLEDAKLTYCSFNCPKL